MAVLIELGDPELGQTEVEELDAVPREHDVARLQIAVNDAVTVCSVERLGDLGGDGQGPLERQRAARQFGRERLAIEQLHHQERHAVLLADVEQGADVRMIDPGDGASLTPEALELPRTRARRRSDRLDRHESIQSRILRAIDFAHAPGVEERQHFVGSDARTRLERHNSWQFGELLL